MLNMESFTTGEERRFWKSESKEPRGIFGPEKQCWQ